ncbi:hypothetical protein F0562_025112 [Nyssa sinensis]|uniref:EF-hand domain-containing protein n=1 Tax=Nyssa sinensis TaxID=561372 RepID=A0A5J5BH20_9ASTE|nr:hypothetical protein F0562_025112 [Nyssa sinensis]
MATTTASLPQQQQPEEVVPNPEAVSSSGYHSSGSIGPFFAVISVLTVLSILSCVLGRICTRQAATPLESIKNRGFFGWVKRKCSQCVAGGDEVLGVKAVVVEKDSSNKAQDDQNTLCASQKQQKYLSLVPTTVSAITTTSSSLSSSPSPLSSLSCNNKHCIIIITIMINVSILPVDQFNQLRDIFSRFDMDSDGSLTHLELTALLRSLGLKPSGDQIYVLFADMDSNGNGAVEFDELVNAILPDMINEEILKNQEQLLEIFRSFDRDGNGYITLAELAGSMAKMGQPLTYRELTEMIQEADTDGDGVISFNEFTSIMAKSAGDFLGLPGF